MSSVKRCRSKYHAAKVIADGMCFDSRKEARRWQELKLLEQAGEISGLHRQISFLLIPEHREPNRVGKRGGKLRGKILERAVRYVADFTYIENGKLIVEDSKGVKTKEYIIKRKLMLDRYGIRIRET